MMNDLGRDEKGRFEASHGLSAGDVFEAMEPREPYSTSEIADQLDVPKRTALHYLNQLADQGRIQKKQPAATMVIWMRGK